MKPGIKELTIFREDIRGMFRFAADLGCQGVQLSLPNDEQLQQIEAAMAETGLAVVSVCAMSCAMLGPDRERQTHEHRQVERALTIADHLGAGRITNFMGGDPSRSLSENAGEFARVYEPHVRTAERLGLRINFENCPMLQGTPRHAANLAWCPAHWRAFFDALNSPVFGIEFDIAHCVTTGLDPLRIIRDWGERIDHVQIKDAKIDREALAEHGSLEGIAHDFVPLGEGDLPGLAIFAELAAINYAGWVTADFASRDLAAVTRNAQAMTRGIAEAIPSYG
jgi:sugar phosphate isomerase/epimerase